MCAPPHMRVLNESQNRTQARQNNNLEEMANLIDQGREFVQQNEPNDEIDREFQNQLLELLESMETQVLGRLNLARRDVDAVGNLIDPDQETMQQSQRVLEREANLLRHMQEIVHAMELEIIQRRPQTS